MSLIQNRNPGGEKSAAGVGVPFGWSGRVTGRAKQVQLRPGVLWVGCDL